ncbi:M20 metallopeptidase family protein [Paenibacillus sp. GXUN7292]|uniref:M20 metallopeptidase family protein n=1 Tax=Paenibacillus sp. GXUN7292 TaxID=3422499 RepID=UPI003D7E43A8
MSFDVIKQQAVAMQEELVAFRRELHLFPELSLQESETSRKVKQELEQIGAIIKTDPDGFGFIAEFKGEEAGPVIALRADMDALPIEEETAVPFASKNKGVMHACGHDGHTAMLMGAAKIIAKQSFKGTIRLLFQAAEEINAGAKSLIAAGALDGVSEIYGLHNLPTLPAGMAATRSGSLMGSVDRIEIKLEGKGGHGAIPDQSIDPVVAASAIVMGLQTIVSREISPFQPVVVTIGSIQSGIANNVIPHYAEMTGTIRTFDPAVQAGMHKRIERIVKQIAASYRCEANLKYISQTPVLVNHEQPLEHMETVIDEVIGRNNRVEAAPTLAGEDFSVYLQSVPGCFFWLGAGPAENADQAFGLHHPKYNLNEDCLAHGTALLAAIALQRLAELGGYKL